MSKVKKSLLVTFIVVLSAAAVLLLVYGIFLGIYKADNYSAPISGVTKYIAHRGLSSEYYQNSEAAFTGAGQSDFFAAIETDIWRTSDGKYVCCHDENPFEDSSVKITDVTYEQASALPLAKSKAGKGVAVDGDIFICSFQKYLEVCAQYGKTPVIEIKFDASKERLAEIITEAEKKFALDKIQIISFNLNVIKRLAEIENGILSQWLSSKSVEAMFGSDCGYNLNLNYATVTKSLIKSQHKQKRLISAWTVNDKETAIKLASMGVDYITTDFDFGEI
jgi:glycerophosphoryl diester phosphodiesterase